MSLHTIRQENTMSSTQLAELLGKTKSKVNEQIRKMFSAKIDDSIIGSSKDSRGYVTDYHLPELESNMYAAKYDDEQLEKVCAYWIERKSHIQPSLPKDYSQALRMLADEVEAKQRLAIENEKQRRSLKNKDHLILASNEASIKAGEILVREFAKSIDVIEVGQNKMYDWLKQQGYIMESKEPYQRYINLGWFSWKPSKEEINGKYRYTLRITPCGKVKLAARYLDHIEAVEMGEAA